MVEGITFPRLIGGAIAAVLVLFAIGWATREDPADKPYLRILGGGFIFNYRIADVHYGFTAVVERPLPTGSVIEASFEDPGGGPPILVRTRVGTDTAHYTLRTPPVRGVKANHPYEVAIRVFDRDEKTELWRSATHFSSQIGDEIVPEKPLTIGPGYARNPD